MDIEDDMCPDTKNSPWQLFLAMASQMHNKSVSQTSFADLQFRIFLVSVISFNLSESSFEG